MSQPHIPTPDPDDSARRSMASESLPGEEDACNPQWRQLFEEAEGGLRAFLRNRLRQESDVDDCLQVVFVKMLESIQEVAPAARRAWLFRVAANESARMWRSESSKQRMLQQHGADEAVNNDPIEQVILTETTLQLQRALSRLPPAWQQVVRLRIHHNLTFQEIADQLDIPLGTALTQMRRSLDRLKSEVDQNPT